MRTNHTIRTGRIGKRLLTALILFSSFITIFTSAIQLYVDYQDDLDRIHEQLYQIEQFHLKPLSESVWALNEEMIKSQIHALVNLPSIEQLAIFINGKSTWSEGPNPEDQNLIRELPLVHHAKIKEIDLGYLRISVNLRDIYQKLIKKVWVIIATNSIKTFLVALFLFFLFHFMVTRHLLHIASYTKNLDINAPFFPLELSRKQRLEKSDELDEVVRSTNEQIQELKIIHDNLEETVKKRTQQLMESNQMLKESEYKFRSLSDATFEGIVISDEGTILEANKAALIMFGYSGTNFIGKKTFSFVAPEYREEVKSRIQSGDEEAYQVTGIKKDGTAFPMEVCGKTFSFRGKRARVTALRDLTERKNAEEEIKTLQGIIPICANCKEIRDDQGYWNRLELYISKHSSAEFSHSICPKCAKELYPDIDIYEK